VPEAPVLIRHQDGFPGNDREPFVRTQSFDTELIAAVARTSGDYSGLPGSIRPGPGWTGPASYDRVGSWQLPAIIGIPGNIQEMLSVVLRGLPGL